MVAEVINGKELSMQLKLDMKKEVEYLKQQNILPHLTVVLVGNNPASRSYVNGKKRASEEVGISSEIVELPDTVTEKELLQTIEQLNSDNGVHGILVQLPLPDHINVEHIIESIDPKKDVDGFHPYNIGKMMTGQDTFLPCTPYGIITMLKSKNITIEGKHAVVIGRSNIVGKPVGQLLLNENATVTYCHSKTNNLKEITNTADILIVAVGRPNVIDKAYIKEGAVVIDVGINRLEDGSLTGDVDFESASEQANYITPVPRGVGPMTITMLLHNTIKAAKGLVK
ncbi:MULTISPECIES: bifunctional methylenetetrahydrofolate dehydrogenase/methenyltetrahydrofolate cyclohydrolase FolD [Ornithinibacillus]|uniref:Bifunctional protein FolD n=2 Tax=Ornithinibacillus TaxID=484508 RepID=A0A923L635_9BACI|nr:MULTISPECIES: bifunctional methylenetetrahydrofolate dehydrogenase/methenyltetrahydrofolate cyclohydrolase FolD [Ornithinibacillus]MBC5637168.1 bifunctional methylenetetrahydrofolate dehydrogenase/methenyltetrahydrofolate cyclohydrolase FolD [Ornithinibacillus hominis]MBS3679621.1 bifunctional methylenetetrahydrofolate dehydrogenase/methenyltetrahydrofolate cyclohydrolase FolD [Ornithinibacillus massiliensis]